MWQIDDIDAELGHLLFGLLPSFAAFPVIPDKDGVKRAYAPPYFLFVERVHQKGFIDCLDVADDGEAILFADDGRFILIGFDEFIRVDADHQIVASLFGMIQQVQVPDMKHVEDALCVADMVMFGHRFKLQ